MNLVIYTDDQPLFEKHLSGVPLQFEHLDSNRIKGFIKNEYVHRVKICVIQDCMKKYGANVFFVDGDTYFLKSPVSLFNKISKDCTVFHMFEFTIADGGGVHEVPMWLTLRKLARDYEYSLKGQTFKLDFNSQMWNSGVLGLSVDHYQSIDDVLALNDQMTEKAKFKTAEQFSFAYVLGKITNLKAANDCVYHYWQSGLKELYNYHIDLFLNQNSKVALKEKSRKALNLIGQQDELSVPGKTLFERFGIRLKLIWKVAKYGHI
ncbi:hypothetical protein [Rufibacter roseolus]|uniref:hypothetical protein n=1 Tax=Rufibacter roseolus TaxID=2817375 RepID=UPI001B30BD2C|nr:hypothetical protein [Rufibacter roseolus]